MLGFPGGSSGKESTCWCRRCRRLRLYPWTRKIPWSRKWQPAPVFLPGRFRGQRSLTGYSPWGHKESDVTEQLSTQAHTHTHTSFVTNDILDLRTRSLMGEGSSWSSVCNIFCSLFNSSLRGLSTTNCHLPRTLAICLCKDWTLCCCSCRPLTHFEVSWVWRMRHAMLQGSWWDKSLHSLMFSGTHLITPIFASPHI